ncbi:MAG: 30S ribosomal protein S17 [Victivallales bacterium]|nr:30S ribosomal protein S17 [Victivallales bacterium]
MAITQDENKAVRGNRKQRVGVVISAACNKTITVEVTRRTAHKLYKKVVNIKKRYAVHDENNVANVGDFVRISETRPLSKTKNWRLLEIIRRADEQ